MSLPTLQQGDQGPGVSAMQLALAALGFDVGKLDGVFSESTAIAVATFQKSQGLDPSGVVDDATWELLGGQAFDPSEGPQINIEEFPSLARVVIFGASTAI
jgi:peptidoglycan hydrolase-like protein with peptidoglycan-binding domain